MSETPPNTGPNRNTLRQLAQMLPSVIQGIKEGTLGGRGRKVPILTVHYRKTCKICCALFDAAKLGPGAEVTPQPGICDRCQGMLDQGYIAFTCSTGPEGRGRFCFAQSDRLKDKAGTIMPINPEVFDRLAAHYKAEWQKETESTNEPDNPRQDAAE